MAKKKAGKKSKVAKVLSKGPAKYKLKIKKPRVLNTHKHRSQWFQNRVAWPFREPPEFKLSKERKRASSMNALEGEAQWSSVGPTNVGGRVTCISVHPDNADDIIIGAAGGGLWKSPDGGLSWTSLWDQQDLNVGSLARDPSNADILYCGTGEANLSADSYPGEGIYRSTNNGRSWRLWSKASTTGIPTRIGSIAVNPFDSEQLILGGVGYRDTTNSGLYVSNDSGKTWQRHNFISNQNYWCHHVVFHPTRQGVVFATVNERGAKSGIWRSKDSGQTWHQLTEGLPSPVFVAFSRTTLAIAPSQPDTMYAIAAENFNDVLGVFRSDDMGDSWVNVAGNHFKEEGQMSYNNAIAVHPEDPDFVICGGVDLHASKDGGKKWKKVTQWYAKRGTSQYAHADQHALAMPAAVPGRIYACNDGGLDLSEDSGKTWQNRSNGLAITMYYDLDVATSNGKYFGGGAQDNGTLITVTGQEDDYFELLGGDGGWLVFHPKDENHVFASYQFFHIYRFSQGTYKDVSPPATDAERQDIWMAFTAMNPDKPKQLFTGSNRVWRTNDSGDQWKPVSPVLDNSAISAIEIATANTKQVYVGTTNGGVFRSLDSGKSWSTNLASAELPGKIVTRIDTSPDDADLIYVTVGGFGNAHVFKSEDAGLSWQDIDQGILPDVPHNAIAVRNDMPDHVYIANDVGVFVSTDRGGTWGRLTRNLPNVPVVDLVYHEAERTLTAATYGRSLWRIDIT